MFDSGTAALLGSFIGALSGIITQITIESYRRRRDRQVAAFALAGSIRAIIQRTADYNYVGIGSDYLTRLEKGERVSMKGVLVQGPDADPIWEKHYDKVGLLGADLSSRVIDFYSAVSGLRYDIGRLYRGDLDANPDGISAMLNHGLSLWSEAKANGELLIGSLKALHR